jgi:hypothetical protein
MRSLPDHSPSLVLSQTNEIVGLEGRQFAAEESRIDFTQGGISLWDDIGGWDQGLWLRLQNHHGGRADHHIQFPRDH